MTAIRLGLSELRRLAAGTLPRLAILAMALIPTLYAGLYLFANHDPYDKLDEIPAALVVLDEGTTTTDAQTGATTRRRCWTTPHPGRSARPHATASPARWTSRCARPRTRRSC